MVTNNKLINFKTKLWNMACNLRGNMDPLEFKDYILSLLCFHYLSEKFENYLKDQARITIEDYPNHYKEPELLKELKINLGFLLKPKQLWSYFIQTIDRREFRYNLLANAFVAVEDTSKDTAYHEVFENLFSAIDLDNNKISKNESQKNTLVAMLITQINNICPFNSDCSDCLGDIYEYLIGEFAASAGKKAGKFFTPSSVSTLMAQIVTSDPDKNHFNHNLKIYDPTCGSGSLLLKVVKQLKVKIKTQTNYKINLYGQELNNTTYNLARMNMLLYTIKHFEIDLVFTNTLTDLCGRHLDLVKKEGGFNIIVSNPPYSQKWLLDTNEESYAKEDQRFSGYPKLAPKSFADLAFVQHMLYCLKKEGICTVVLPHGVLFRGNKEASIRKQIIENHYLDAVIGLPKNIFYGAPIATCILVFRKCQKQDNILFIDASNQYQPGTKNSLSQTNVDCILDLYLKRQTIKNISYVAPLDQIIANNYELSISRYIINENTNEIIDIATVKSNIESLEAKKQELNQQIRIYLEELGI